MMKIAKFHKYEKGSLKGFLDILLPELNWVIRGCGLFEKNGRMWISPPTKMTKDSNGDPQYQDIINMPAEDKRKFCDGALAAYKEFLYKETIEEKQPEIEPEKEIELPF